MLKRFFAMARRLASGLVAALGWQTERDYVERPWTEEENADFQEFKASIGAIPSDPDHARAMEDGELGEFFNNDPWHDTELPRA